VIRLLDVRHPAGKRQTKTNYEVLVDVGSLRQVRVGEDLVHEAHESVSRGTSTDAAKARS
jgi:hypothetical protein